VEVASAVSPRRAFLLLLGPALLGFEALARERFIIKYKHT
jgi:hypothetical protein